METMEPVEASSLSVEETSLDDDVAKINGNNADEGDFEDAAEEEEDDDDDEMPRLMVEESKDMPEEESQDQQPENEEKDLSGGLVMLDMSKDIAKVDTDEDEDDGSNDINRNRGQKRKLSGDKSGDDGLGDASTPLAPKRPALADDPCISDSDLLIQKQTLGKGKRARIPNKRYSDIVVSPNHHSSRPTPPTRLVENGAEHQETEDKPPLLLPAEETPVKSSKVVRAPVDITNPLFLVPLDQGWKRELVWRAASDKNNKIAGDIYYYTPAGKKLRSMREVGEFVLDTDLSIDNFTFFKAPLGTNDPEKEIIRDAKKPQSMARKAALAKAGAEGGKAAKSPKTSSPKTPGPKSSKSSTPKVAKAETLGSESGKKSKGLGNFKIKAPSKGKSDKKSKNDNSKLGSELDSPIEATKTSSRKSSKWSNFDREKSNAKSTANSAAAAAASKPCQPCTILCTGVQGVVPTLQCRVCLCLYHPECVGYTLHPALPYICKNCNPSDQAVGDSQTTVDLPPPPLTPVNTLLPTSVPPATLPKLQRISYDSEPPQLTPECSTLPTIRRPSIEVLPIPPPPPVIVPCGENTTSLVGAVTTWLPHNSTIVDNIQRVASERTEAPRPQYLEILAGRKFLVIPKHNFMTVSPTIAPTASNDRPPSRLQPAEIPEGTNAPVEPAQGAESEVAKEATVEEPEKSQTQGVMGSSPSREPGEENTANAVIKIEEPEEVTQSDSPKNRSSKKLVNITNSSARDEPRFMANYLQNVSYAYNTLLYVFQYLKVQDLLRAGCVCVMWRDIANHSLLWRTVRMKNSQVHKFEGLANTLKKHGTVHLDLRKMLPPTGGDEIWPHFSTAIERVESLRKIDLCRCPASVVEKLALSNPNLEVINAVTIKCESMSLEPFSFLKNIKELRVKSTQGLVLTSSIAALKNLTTLTHLSLTSIRDLNTFDLSVLAELTKLESLDLGECTDFREEFGKEILSKLENLEKLRLEKGQGECHTFEMLDAVKDMPKLEQLELVNFDIKAGFDKALGACLNIKRLLIIPTYISQSATTNHMVLGGVLQLQKTLSHFVWGVTLELLRVTELFVDQCEVPERKEKKDKKKPGSGDSIPVLKPVPLLQDPENIPVAAHDPPQVEILPLPHLQKLLMQSLPSTRVKILKIPFHATWRQSISDTGS